MTRTGRPLKVAVTTKPLDNWNSGSGHHLDELLTHVLDIADREYPDGFDFTFVHYNKSENPLYKRVHELLIPRNPFSASRALGRQNFDIIHYTPLSIFAPIWVKSPKKTATIHGIEERLLPQGYPLHHRLHEYYLHPAYMRMMDGIATVSETGKKWFIDHYGIKKDRIIVTPNAVSQQYRVLPASETQKTGKPYILHISRFSERKNPQGIMGGFAEFIALSGLDVDLVCAGKGWNSDEALEFARFYGIFDRYHAPGFIETEEAVRLLNGAEAFVFPSWAEGFGMPNLEAMACGCPVVTSSIFAIPEVVGEAGILVSRPDARSEIARALADICTNPSLRSSLIEKGFGQSKKFDWDESARAILSFWKSLA